jgi:hypothetical protein
MRVLPFKLAEGAVGRGEEVWPNNVRRITGNLGDEMHATRRDIPPLRERLALDAGAFDDQGPKPQLSQPGHDFVRAHKASFG